MARSLAIALSLLACQTALASCGSGAQTTPSACLGGPPPFFSALRQAPAQVRLASSGVPISACLVRDQSAGELSTVGAAMIVVATKLNERARRDPSGAETLELGYLLGAANRGAQRGAGIQANLLQRLDSAARFAPAGQPLPPAFRRAYASGYAAGRANG